jgi:hypothetical protein
LIRQRRRRGRGGGIKPEAEGGIAGGVRCGAHELCSAVLYHPTARVGLGLGRGRMLAPCAGVGPPPALPCRLLNPAGAVYRGEGEGACRLKEAGCFATGVSHSAMTLDIGEFGMAPAPFVHCCKNWNLEWPMAATEY